MSTAYNLRAALDRSARADVNKLTDPGSGGVVRLAQKDLAVVTLSGAGGRTLEPAAGVPLGTRVVAFSTSDSATLNTVPVLDGDAVEFIVKQNAAGAHEWEHRAFSPYVLTTQVLAASGSITAAQVATALLQIVDDLEAAGLVDASGISQTP